MWIIAGLGNPGKRYDDTRHNVGFMSVDHIRTALAFPNYKNRFKALCSEGSLFGEKVLLLLPQTYMNLSGESVSDAMNYYSVDIANLLVIHDDLDLPLGRIKMKQGGSSAGHNGIRSIDNVLNNRGYLRLRIGIGRPLHPSQTIVDYVLSAFFSLEKNVLARVFERTELGVVDLIKNGLVSATKLCNTNDEAS